MLNTVDSAQLKNSRGRLTAFGKSRALQIGIDGIENLKDPVDIIQDLMVGLNVRREAAINGRQGLAVGFVSQNTVSSLLVGK